MCLWMLWLMCDGCTTFQRELGAPPGLVWICWGGMALAGALRNCYYFCWVYPWSRIEELDFSFGSASDVFGWVQSLSLWLFLLLNCSVCCERTGCMLITAPGAEKSMTMGCDLNYMMITLNYSTAWYWQPCSYYCHIYSLIQMFLSQILFQPTSKYFIFGVSNEKSCSCLVLNYHWFENNQEKE